MPLWGRRSGMGLVEQSIVVALPLERAEGEWREYIYRDEIGHGRGPAGEVAFRESYAEESAELVTFEELSPSSTRVTLRAEYDDDEEDVDVSSLRADVNDELARYREFVERRAAA
jgi:hypothetical protein